MMRRGSSRWLMVIAACFALFGAWLARRAPTAPDGSIRGRQDDITFATGSFITWPPAGCLSVADPPWEDAMRDVLGARYRRRLIRTLRDLRTIGTAVESYSIDADVYPIVASVEDLRPLLAPTYVTTFPMRDGWGHPFRFNSNGQEYTTTSSGPDATWEPAQSRRQGTNEEPTLGALFADLLRHR